MPQAKARYCYSGLCFFSSDAKDAMWHSAPHPAIISPLCGYGRWDDFTSFSPDDWTVTVVEAGTGNSTIVQTDGAGGIVRINCADDENDGAQAQSVGEMITLESSNLVWFDAKVDLTEEATQSDAFVGLAVSDTTIIAGAPNDYVLWAKDDGDTNWDFRCADGGSGTAKNGLATAAAATSVVLGFTWDGTTLTPYIDGVASSANAITTNIPTAEAMMVSFGYLNGAASAQDDGMNLDFIRWVVQQDRS